MRPRPETDAQRQAREFRIVLRDEGDDESRIRRLRSCLKRLLRDYGFRNVGLVPAIDEEGKDPE